tara:strand:- start:1433 stop:1672 length:240 start_codon:yes stop_codon:yes gene_type:complete
MEVLKRSLSLRIKRKGKGGCMNEVEKYTKEEWERIQLEAESRGVSIETILSDWRAVNNLKLKKSVKRLREMGYKITEEK